MTKNKIIWVASQKIEGKIPTKTYPMQIISAIFGALVITEGFGK
jgi:hypothetical protein